MIGMTQIPPQPLMRCSVTLEQSFNTDFIFLSSSKEFLLIIRNALLKAGDVHKVYSFALWNNE